MQRLLIVLIFVTVIVSTAWRNHTRQPADNIPQSSLQTMQQAAPTDTNGLIEIDNAR